MITEVCAAVLQYECEACGRRAETYSGQPAPFPYLEFRGPGLDHVLRGHYCRVSCAETAIAEVLKVMFAATALPGERSSRPGAR